jgi:hypothetical protein
MIITIAEITITSRTIEVADTPYNRRQIDNANAFLPNIISDKNEHDNIIKKLQLLGD